MLSMIDVPFLLLCLFFAVWAAARGFTKEFFSKLALVLGAICAVFFFPILNKYMMTLVKNDFASSICSFIIVFLTVYLIVRIIQQIVSMSLSGQEILAGLDRVMGFFFGALEGLVICTVILLLLKMQPWFDLESLYSHSIFYEKLLPFIQIAERKIV